MTTIEQVTWIIRAFEGDLFTDDPIDTGGATKYGITLRTLAAYRGQPTTKEDVRNLTEPEAVSIGVAIFAEESGLGEIAWEDLRLVCLDYAFHSGWVPAIKALQRAIGGVLVDGVWGPQTQIAVNRLADDHPTAQAICTDREVRMQARIRQQPDQKKYAVGWWTRVTTVRQQLHA
jgi:lysozyme family protein